VDILDLVVVGSNFGKAGVDVQGDADGNGVVDIFDLVLVASHFGDVIFTAPASFVEFRSDDFSRFSDEQLESLGQALTELEAMLNPLQGVIIARDLLRNWLKNARQIVTETKLLSNYPNPFNPETWIPFDVEWMVLCVWEYENVSYGQVKRHESTHYLTHYRNFLSRCTCWSQLGSLPTKKPATCY
jgi:hypothetical protein